MVNFMHQFGPQVPRHLVKYHSKCVYEGVLDEINI